MNIKDSKHASRTTPARSKSNQIALSALSVALFAAYQPANAVIIGNSPGSGLPFEIIGGLYEIEPGSGPGSTVNSSPGMPYTVMAGPDGTLDIPGQTASHSNGTTINNSINPAGSQRADAVLSDGQDTGTRTNVDIGYTNVNTTGSGTAPGNEPVALHATGGGNINLEDHVIVAAAGAFSVGVEADAGSSVIADGFFNPGSVTMSGGNSQAAFANGGSIQLYNETVLTKEDDSNAVIATNGGYGLVQGGSIQTAGMNSPAVEATGSNAAGTKSEVDIQPVAGFGAEIATFQSGSPGLWADSGGIIEVDDVGPDKVAAVHPNTVNANGANSYAVEASGGGSVILNDTLLTTAGANAHGIYAFGNGSSVTANTVAIGTTLSASAGVYADGGTVTIDNTIAPPQNLADYPAQIMTSGQAAQGLVALDDGTVNATNATVQTSGAGSTGLVAGSAAAPGGTITMHGGSVTTTHDDTDAAVAQNGGTIDLEDGASVTAHGKSNFDAKTPGYAPVHAVAAINDGHVKIGQDETPGDPVHITASGYSDKTFGLFSSGTGSTIVSNNAIIEVTSIGVKSGNNPLGVNAEAGGTINLTNSSVSMTGGGRSYGLEARSGGTVTAIGTDISTLGDNSHAVQAYAGSFAINGESSIAVTGGSVETSGQNSYGLYAQNYGAEVSGSDVTVATGDPSVPSAGTGTQGLNSMGVEAYGGGYVKLDGSTVTTYGREALGIYATGAGTDPSKNVVGSQIDVTNTNVTVTGSGSVAAAVDGGATLNIGKSDGTGGGIYTSAQGPALAVGNGGTVNVNNAQLVSSQAAAISVTDNANVTINNTIVKSTNAASIESTLTQDATQKIFVGASSDLTQNNGTLLQVNREGTGAQNASVTLELGANSNSSGNIADNGTGTAVVNFQIDKGASWSGAAQSLNNANIGDKASFTYTGGAITGNVTAGQHATVSFNQDAANIGGTVTAGSGTTVAFHGDATIGTGVASTGSTVTFAKAATIRGNVSASGTGALIQFSAVGSASITGDVVLDQGATTHGGTVDNLINVTGSAQVSNGATLGGDMAISGTVSGTSGILAPGNSVGTLKVGSLASNFTGTYEAQVNAAGQSDQIIVQSGDVNLKGIDLKVSGEKGPSDYLLNKAYTILQTQDGNVNGQFNSIDGSAFAGTLAELAPVMYGPNNVQVEVVVNEKAVAAALPGLTKNEASALRGAASITGPSEMTSALFTSQVNPALFDQISGESYASVKTAMVDETGYVRDAATDRLRTAFGDVGAPLDGAMTLDANGKPVEAAPNSRDVAVWTKAFGAFGHIDGVDGTSKLSETMGGAIVGADALVGNNWRVGGLFGYSHSNYNVDNLGSSAGSDAYHLGVYGGTQMGDLGIRLGASYSYNDVNMGRNVAFAEYSDHPDSHFNAGAGQIFGDVGYRFFVNGIGFEPFGALAYVNLHTDAFSETGGDAALSGQSDTLNSLFSTVGLRSSATFSVGHVALTGRSSIGWRHAFGNVTPTSTLAFTGGQNFTVEGVPIARDAAVVNVGLDASITKKMGVGVSYTGQLSGRTQDHSFMATANYKF